MPARSTALRDLAAEADKAGRRLDSFDLMNARGWLFARAYWNGVKQDAIPALVCTD
jgi:hypothetical protein